MDEKEDKAALSSQDWADAALEAIAEQGPKGVSVEPLARRLGVTKGSFYWHFSNRRALLVATLEYWERRETDAVLARAAQESDPRKRLARLFREADGSQRAGRVYLSLTQGSLTADAEAIVERVVSHRLDFLRDCYRDICDSEVEANDRAVLAYSLFIGTLQMRRDRPDALPTGTAFHDYMHYIGEALIPGYSRDAVRADAHAVAYRA